MPQYAYAVVIMDGKKKVIKTKGYSAAKVILAKKELEKDLKAAGIEYTYIGISEHPPTTADLKISTTATTSQSPTPRHRQSYRVKYPKGMKNEHDIYDCLRKLGNPSFPNFANKHYLKVEYWNDYPNAVQDMADKTFKICGLNPKYYNVSVFRSGDNVKADRWTDLCISLKQEYHKSAPQSHIPPSIQNNLEEIKRTGIGFKKMPRDHKSHWVAVIYKNKNGRTTKISAPELNHPHDFFNDSLKKIWNNDKKCYVASFFDDTLYYYILER